MKKDVVAELGSVMKTRKKKLDQNEILQEAQKLLEYNAVEDLEMMRALGPKSQLAQSEKERGKVIEIEKAEKFMGGEVYTRDQIIKLAIKYRLKFLQSKHYVGHIDTAVIPIIKDMQREMSKTMTIERASREGLTVEEYVQQNAPIEYKLDKNTMKENFYILAPPSMFSTEKADMTKFTILTPDPIMFYSDDQEHFRLIKKWGTDFTVARLILGFMGRSTECHRGLYAMAFSLIALTITFFLGWGFLFLLILNVPIMLFGDDSNEAFGENHVTNKYSFYF